MILFNLYSSTSNLERFPVFSHCAAENLMFINLMKQIGFYNLQYYHVKQKIYAYWS